MHLASNDESVHKRPFHLPKMRKNSSHGHAKRSKFNRLEENRSNYLTWYPRVACWHHAKRRSLILDGLVGAPVPCSLTNDYYRKRLTFIIFTVVYRTRLPAHFAWSTCSDIFLCKGSKSCFSSSGWSMGTACYRRERRSIVWQRTSSMSLPRTRQKRNRRHRFLYSW